MPAIDAIVDLVVALDTFIEKHPERVTPELRAAFEAFTARTSFSEEAECRHCGAAIMRRSEGRWVHLSGDRGCRAATFSPGRGWDDSLERLWMATPRQL